MILSEECSALLDVISAEHERILTTLGVSLCVRAMDEYGLSAFSASLDGTGHMIPDLHEKDYNTVSWRMLSMGVVPMICGGRMLTPVDTLPITVITMDEKVTIYRESGDSANPCWDLDRAMTALDEAEILAPDVDISPARMIMSYMLEEGCSYHDDMLPEMLARLVVTFTEISDALLEGM